MLSNITLIIIVCVLLLADILCAILLFYSKGRRRRRAEKYSRLEKRVIDALAGFGDDIDLPGLKIDPGMLFSIFKSITVSIELSETVKRKFIDFFNETGIVKKYCLRIKSLSRIKRSEAALNLAFLPCNRSRRTLESAMENEKHYHIKVFIVNSLIEIDDSDAIPYILQTLIGSPQWYKEKICSIMWQFSDKLHSFLINLSSIDLKDLKMVIVSFAKYYFSPDLKALLLEFIKSDDPDIANPASDACLKFYPEQLRSGKYIKSAKPYIKRNAVAATGLLATAESIETLAGAMRDGEIFDMCVSAISGIIISNSQLLQVVESRFTTETDPVIKKGLAEVLSNRIEYILTKLRFDNSEKLKKLIVDIISQGNLSSTIAFLNENSDQKLEGRICEAVEPLLQTRDDIVREFRLYLNERVLEKMKLAKLEPQKGDPRAEVVRIDLLRVFLGIAVLSFPAAFIINYWGTFVHAGFYGTLKNLFYLFNYFFAFYGITLNSIYLLLLVFSFIGSRMELRCWNMKDTRFLFKQGILPSISIIAPAYGEEATIIESVSSLLNLSYPDYEVIVVNDGSTDNTLRTLIDNFNLKRVDMDVAEKLKTGSLRGLYRNRYIPNLTVVDKVNGGKADSLNAGINIATKEYFCGIDADSLLERDSLLKMASPFLDSDREVIATGGNIVPVNGCTVDKGYLTRIQIPGNFLSRLQTMEYIRSFISGRIGWATIRCLLIISGAFGLFRKSSVIASGGYMTGKEKFGKDTVGEDMELVVRLIKDSKRRGENGNVNYVFNANCWTEVPESYTILRKQRDRWQRGLLDIMTFHIGMLFNPLYREVGLIAFPYFIIFEVIGPWIEAQGLFMFITALAMGLLTTHIVLLFFIGTIFMGIAVSITSFYIMERGNNYFSNKDISVLILYAFIENFGIRQYFSLLRLGGYINALRNVQGWGKMVRKGFQNKPGTA